MELLSRLKEISNLIAAKKEVTEVTHEDALKIESFSHDYENTRPLIDAQY